MICHSVTHAAVRLNAVLLCNSVMNAAVRLNAGLLHHVVACTATKCISCHRLSCCMCIHKCTSRPETHIVMVVLAADEPCARVLHSNISLSLQCCFVGSVTNHYSSLSVTNNDDELGYSDTVCYAERWAVSHYLTLRLFQQQLQTSASTLVVLTAPK